MGSPHIPDPAPPTLPPKPVSQSSLDSLSAQRRKLRMLMGPRGSYLTGPQGVLTQATTQTKTLLGA